MGCLFTSYCMAHKGMSITIFDYDPCLFRRNACRLPSILPDGYLCNKDEYTRRHRVSLIYPPPRGLSMKQIA